MTPIRAPLVSILINNYNYGRFISEAIESALAQGYPHVEVVVVDDGSTDDSRQRIDAYGDRIRRVFQSNAGQAAAFNAGFAASHGDVICFLDADDRFCTGKLDAIVELYDMHANAGWVFHRLRLFGDAVQNSESNDSRGAEFVDLRSDLARGRATRSAPATSALTFRRELLARILPMPVEIRITSDNFLKFAALGISPGVLSPAQLADQRIHGANAYTLNSSASSLRGEIAMTTAHHLRQRFPHLRHFAHGVYARGLSRWLTASPRRASGRSVALEYVRGLGAVDAGEVVVRSAVNIVRRIASR